MKERICKISLFSAILACVSAMPVDSMAKQPTGSNRSYAGAYQQINAMAYQAEYDAVNTPTAITASATANLPVMVSDEQLAKEILSNESKTTNLSELEACAMIYPNGVFKWDVPESGVRKNQVQQCVSVIELRDANTNAVLATTTVAAGDTMKCNIDSFPESGMSSDVKYGKIELPADTAPTMEDVEAVMNEEQKQNAGLKIAAGAIIAGVAGNLLAPKDAGSKTGSIPVGTGKTQLIDTAIGAAAGAGIMAASTYSGKVAGDTIKSTAVNAASGMVVGNMMAGGSASNSVMATTKCKTDNWESDCVIGSCAVLATDGDIQNGTSGNYYFFIKKKSCDEILKCQINSDNKYVNCVQESSLAYENIIPSGSTKQCSAMKESDFETINETYIRDSDKPDSLKTATDNAGDFVAINTASKVSKREHAYAVVDLGVKPLGYKISDWDNLKSGAKYYHRNNDGSVGAEIKECTTFKPSSRDASDGGLVDLSNQARAKGTMIGTAAGGAMGGFAGYQGAKSEITDRWTSAVRAYEDSLSNFVCVCGSRPMAKYNDYLEIPELKKSDK